MARKVRIATFNCENLFTRHRFGSGIRESDITKEGWDLNQNGFVRLKPRAKELTAKTINALKADIVALQEVEGIAALKSFRNKFLGGFKAYPHVALIGGNDPRLIDVAVLSKYPIIHARSYQHVKETPQKRNFIFSRDCLEVDISIYGKPVTLYVNHFKSMNGRRAATRSRRLLQAKTVRRIVTARFGEQAGNHPFIILGDLNDYPRTDEQGASAITLLANWDQVENVVARLPEDERWTHYYAHKDSYSQLDYMLVSNSLCSRIKRVHIERRGLPGRARRFIGARLKGVGKSNPKASDHCPLVVELEI